jgi:uncharacterized protein YndB with AHSA1/START domain
MSAQLRSAPPATAAQHDRFTIERRLAAPAPLVFRAWSTPEGKARWFAGDGNWTLQRREFDFRVGGQERLTGRWNSGTVTDFAAVYHDIEPDQRIVYSYAMQLDERRISVSLSTVEFGAVDGGTLMRYTEQAVYLGGYEDAGSRERGTQELLDRLVRTLPTHA